MKVRVILLGLLGVAIFATLVKLGVFKERLLSFENAAAVVQEPVNAEEANARVAGKTSHEQAIELFNELDWDERGGAPAAPSIMKEGNSKPRLETSLEQLIDIDFKEVELQKVTSHLRSVTGVNIVLDELTLKEHGVNLDHAVSIKVAGVSLKSALRILLRSMNLDYAIRDEAVLITTINNARDRMTRKVYNVADLVVPIEDTPWTREGWQESTKEPSPKKLDTPLHERLVNLIVTNVDQDTWSTAGGKGTIAYFPLGMALVVHQTDDVHEEIFQLLAALRRLQDNQIACELRMIKLPIDCEQLKELTPLEAIYLDEQKAKSLLKSLESAGSVQILQAPKVTVFNGQRASIETIEFEKRLQFSICPVAAADRGSVRMLLAAQFKDAGKTRASFAIEKVLQTRTGETAVLSCGTLSEEGGVAFPLLSDLPVVGALFPIMGKTRETYRVVLTVTPRILHVEQEDANFQGRIPPIPRP